MWWAFNRLDHCRTARSALLGIVNNGYALVVIRASYPLGSSWGVPYHVVLNFNKLLMVSRHRLTAVMLWHSQAASHLIPPLAYPHALTYLSYALPPSHDWHFINRRLYTLGMFLILIFLFTSVSLCSFDKERKPIRFLTSTINEERSTFFVSVACHTFATLCRRDDHVI